jgi:hypothetical protein
MEVPYYISILYLARFVAEALGAFIETFPESGRVLSKDARDHDPSWFSPQVDVWTSDAHPWDQMNPALPKFEMYPPSEGSAAPAAP